VCLSVSEGKQRPLFAPTAVHRLAAIYSSCLFKWRFLTSVIIYRSRWPVQDIRHCAMFGYPYMILANHCHTALWTVKLTVAQQVTVLFYLHECCFNKQLSNKHIFTAHSYFSCTTVCYVEHFLFTNWHTQRWKRRVIKTF